MIDRELLELAAKAAGYGEPWTLPEYDAIYIGPKYKPGYPVEYKPWNPLTDDGDALRLAVALNMDIKQDDPNSAIAGWTNLQRINITHSKQGPWYWKEWLRDNGGDRSSATRRAIVRAAAEIGKSM